MIAFGSRASMSATGIVCGTISEYTLASRTRRAMSWAYCAPKSTTRTRSCSVTALSRLGHRDPSGVGVGAPRSLSAALLLPAQTLPCVRFTLTSTRLSAELRQLGGRPRGPADGEPPRSPAVRERAPDPLSHSGPGHREVAGPGAAALLQVGMAGAQRVHRLRPPAAHPVGDEVDE